MYVRVVGMLCAVVLAAACTSEPDVVDFGVPPPEDGPSMPADDGLDATAEPTPDEVPGPDARLAEGGWPEAAAFIAREAEAGRPTLVNIFASWCVPCRTEMPLLLEARDDNPDVAFLGIDHLDRREDAEAFIDDVEVDFPTIFDIEGDVAFAVGGRAMPTTVVFDAEGRLAGRVAGELNPTSLENLLAEVR